MKTIKTKINGKVIEVSVREFNGMYQIISGSYACGIIRKDEGIIMPTIEFEVRKPKYTFWQRFKKWYYGYSYAYEKWQNRLPNDGDLIELTQLPNPINAPFEKSIWIGTKGIVFDMDKSEGNFCLRLESGATLVCLNENFTYKLFVNHSL